jgi:hypothetical protein
MRSIACLVLMLAAAPAVAKECRTPDVPPGVRVQLPPGCDNPVRTGEAREAKQGSVRAEQGFVEIGGGTKVRIGGRVRAEVGVNR